MPVSLQKGGLRSGVRSMSITYISASYDEDRWPSGSAGGKVIEHNPEFKAKHVLFTPHRYGTVELDGYRDFKRVLKIV